MDDPEVPKEKPEAKSPPKTEAREPDEILVIEDSFGYEDGKLMVVRMKIAT